MRLERFIRGRYVATGSTHSALGPARAGARTAPVRDASTGRRRRARPRPECLPRRRATILELESFARPSPVVLYVIGVRGAALCAAARIAPRHVTSSRAVRRRRSSRRSKSRLGCLDLLEQIVTHHRAGRAMMPGRSPSAARATDRDRRRNAASRRRCRYPIRHRNSHRSIHRGIPRRRANVACV